MSKEVIPFLLNAPPGEYEQCSAALSAIVTNPSIVQSARSSTLVKWTEKECTPVEIDGHNAIICESGRLGEGQYLDAVTNKPFSYNFEQRSVSPGTAPAPQTSELREAVQKEILSYIENTYKQKAAAGAYISGGSIVIILRASSISLRNFRTGHVIAKYTYSGGNLSGRIDSYQHFFENGNAVCQYGAKLNKSVNSSSPAETAKAIVKAISAFEDDWYSEQSDALQTINTDGLKQLRREQNISKTGINWEQELAGVGGMGAFKH